MPQKVLLVEGNDDKHVLTHICKHHDISHFEVKSCCGKDPLLEDIPVRIKALNDEGDVMGVVIDADTDLEKCWQSLHDRFTDAGYQDVPNQPDPRGTILPPPDGTHLPRAGVWIMPNNRTPGILEDFLGFLVPSASQSLLNHAKSCVKSIPAPPFRPVDEPKAVIHTWLAWQKKSGRPFGTAITARFLDPDVPEVDILVAWLQRLFD